MPIFAKTNQYPGINPHLNSYLQHEAGGWENFHSVYVVYLFEVLDEVLPPGYFARSEKSLQISEILTKPDVTIFRTHLSIEKVYAEPATAPTTVLPILATLDEEETLNAVMIYQAEGGPSGRPITRIELLSPANKASGSHHPKYTVKRLQTLQSGLRLVELDFLHESPPILSNIASYPDHEANAQPYNVFVSDPRPTLEQGQMTGYAIGVMDMLPKIVLPLAGADKIAFDLGEVYTRTFNRSRFFQSIVDYEQVPVYFDRYHQDDQTRIRQHMKTLADTLAQ